jgi:hypothetical protein
MDKKMNADKLADALRYAVDNPDFDSAEFDRRARAALAEHDAQPAQAAQPVGVADVFDFAAHLQRQRGWSGATFGPGARVQGVVDHIRKELREIEANPGDLEEWIDVAILALDGAWRSGAQPADIVAALVAKQTKNERRKWPDWRTADPNHAIEHDRSEDDPMSADSSDRRWEGFER